MIQGSAVVMVYLYFQGNLAGFQQIYCMAGALLYWHSHYAPHTSTLTQA